MLTEIEWWGGLLFIWGGLCYWLVARGEDGVAGMYAIITHLAFTSAAGLLALYFYPLATPALSYLYLGLLAAGLLGLLGAFFWSGKEDDDDASSDAAPAAGEDSGEEISGREELVGQLIFFLPLVIAWLLGAYKAYGLVRGLGWLG